VICESLHTDSEVYLPALTRVCPTIADVSLINVLSLFNRDLLALAHASSPLASWPEEYLATVAPAIRRVMQCAEGIVNRMGVDRAVCLRALMAQSLPNLCALSCARLRDWIDAHLHQSTQWLPRILQKDTWGPAGDGVLHATSCIDMLSFVSAQITAFERFLAIDLCLPTSIELLASLITDICTRYTEYVIKSVPSERDCLPTVEWSERENEDGVIFALKSDSTSFFSSIKESVTSLSMGAKQAPPARITFDRAIAAEVPATSDTAPASVAADRMKDAQLLQVPLSVLCVKLNSLCFVVDQLKVFAASVRFICGSREGG
jgi:hypothetical protein